MLIRNTARNRSYATVIGSFISRCETAFTLHSYSDSNQVSETGPGQFLMPTHLSTRSADRQDTIFWTSLQIWGSCERFRAGQKIVCDRQTLFIQHASVLLKVVTENLYQLLKLGVNFRI